MHAAELISSISPDSQWSAPKEDPPPQQRTSAVPILSMRRLRLFTHAASQPQESSITQPDAQGADSRAEQD